ncbi:MAG: hypothetical protein EB059_04445 [Alphaproteobacteria bacterium]|nr:hypothetical protein [Alphaproteobacteria bacterium]
MAQQSGTNANSNLNGAGGAGTGSMVVAAPTRPASHGQKLTYIGSNGGDPYGTQIHVVRHGPPPPAADFG